MGQQLGSSCTSWMTKPNLPVGLTRRRSVGAAAPTASCWLSMQLGIIQYADKGSRDFHGDDIGVDSEAFAAIEREFGSFVIDCFASSSNAKCPRFFSKLDVPGSGGVNFFLQELLECDNHWVRKVVSGCVTSCGAESVGRGVGSSLASLFFLP